MSSQINSEQNSKCKVKMELYIPTYLSIPQLNNYFSPILVYVRDQFYKTILWLVSSSSHTTLHTVHLSISYFSLFIIILLYIRTASKSSSILQNYPLTCLLFWKNTTVHGFSIWFNTNYAFEKPLRSFYTYTFEKPLRGFSISSYNKYTFEKLLRGLSISSYTNYTFEKPLRGFSKTIHVRI